MAFAKLPTTTVIPWHFVKHMKGTTLDTIAAVLAQKTIGTPPPQPRVLFTVRQLAERHPAFPQGSLRNLIFLAANRKTSRGSIRGNGLEFALVRLGRKVLIDEAKFFDWIDAQQVDAP